MPVSLPFTPSDNNYRILVPLQNRPYIFDVRWNNRDEAWYFDIREEDETLILAGVKVLIGSKVGRASNHEFFKTRAFEITDNSGQRLEAAYDDLGDRVLVIITDSSEVIPPT